MPKVRLQKALANAGVASRRAVEEMAVEGRITVNGEPVTALPCFVDLSQDEVRVDGRPIRPKRGNAARRTYILLNKPRGVVCTQRDPEGRPRAVDLVPDLDKRVYCVGRLDKDSTGLVLLTNDGELTERLTHPRYGVTKTYVVQVDGRVGGADVEQLRRGTHLDGRRASASGVKVLRRGRQNSLLEIRLAEGRNREIRRMLARLGHKVRRLKRTAIGPVTDKGLKIGSFRVLASDEVARLRRAARPAGGRRERRHGG